jgi:hypothetical protein
VVLGTNQAMHSWSSGGHLVLTFDFSWLHWFAIRDGGFEAQVQFVTCNPFA